MPYINQPGGGGSGAISGVVVSGTAASGDVPVASSAAAGTWAFPPGHEINYTQITSSVNVVSTTEATGTTIISPGAIVFDGTAVLVEFYAVAIDLPTATSTSNSVVVSLFEGATQIARICRVLLDDLTSGQNGRMPGHGVFRFTPTAASHTYTVTAFATSVTGTPSIEAGAGGTGANAPAFVRFTKV